MIIIIIINVFIFEKIILWGFCEEILGFHLRYHHRKRMS